MLMRHLRVVALSVICAIPIYSRSTQAAVRTWIGGNADWVDGAANNANWTGSDEPDPDDDAVFNTPNTVELESANEVQTLTLSGGIELRAHDNELTVDGLLSLSGAGTNLRVDFSEGTILADSVTINSDAIVDLDDGTLTILEETANGLLDINAGGTLFGHGTVNLNDFVGAGTVLLINDGTITAEYVTPFVASPPPAGTLSINAGDPADARIDLDGTSGDGVLNVRRNQTLEINITSAEVFDGEINLYHNATFDMDAWTLNDGSMIIDNGLVTHPILPDVPADIAYISGTVFNQTNGTITVVDTDGTLQFNSAFTMVAGDFVNNGLVIFNNDALISAGANFTMPTTSSSITVNAGVTVDVDQANFNADGLGTATNVITINSDGVLDLDLGAGADETLTGTIHLNGGELDVTTADDTWVIDATVIVGDGTGTSRMNGEQVSFIFSTITVEADATLDVNAESIWAGGDLIVHEGGTATLDADTRFDSTISTFTGDGNLRIDAASTIAADTTIDTGGFDWDGTSTGQQHVIEEGVTFTINSPTFDGDGDMDEDIDLEGNGSQLIVNGPAEWTMSSLLRAGIIGNDAVIGGTSRMILFGTGTQLSAVGDTTVDAPITFGRGVGSTTAIITGRTLTVEGDAIYFCCSIYGGVDSVYNPPAGNRNTVTHSFTISLDGFDFDRGDWVINPGAALTISVVDYDADEAVNDWESTMTINSGAIDLTSTGDLEFLMNGTLNLNNTTGAIAEWKGATALSIGNDANSLDSNLNVGGTGISQISSYVTFKSDADVDIAAGATLLLTGGFVFLSVNGSNNAEFTGAGTFILESGGAINEETTFDMPGGTVDLDGRDSDTEGDGIEILAPTTINAATMASFGKVNTTGQNALLIYNDIGTGVLTVNLDDPNAEWTITGLGELTLINDNNPSTLLAGSDVNIDGPLFVQGDVRIEARVDLRNDQVRIDTFNEPLRLGGGSLTDPNTIAGAEITGVPGPKLLGADSGKALHGFGTIDADVGIDFDGTAELKADNGTLTINGTIIDVNVLGTADADGILDIPAAWETDGGPGNSIGEVRLNGGQLIGGTITNDNPNGVGGFGLISSRIINETGIFAANGVLVVETAAHNNNWDGVANTGTLEATSGSTLELRDDAQFNFSGAVRAQNLGTVFTSGFAFRFDSASSLQLSAGTFHSTHATSIGGAVLVGSGGDSTIEVDAGQTLEFDSTSATALDANLRLITENGRVRSGATFGGAGALRVMDGSALFPDDAANINVLVDNRGTFGVADAAAGRSDVKDFVQRATGTMEVSIGGTAITQFDRLVLSGAAQLTGTLDLALIGGFVPSLGQGFNIITATGGVSGAFAALNQPAGMPAGLAFDVVYNPTIVRLVVGNALPGDYNRDGSVDAADFVVWRKLLGNPVPNFTAADGNGNGTVDSNDYDVWRRNFGRTISGSGANVAPPGSAVPETSTTVLATVGFLALFAMCCPRRMTYRTGICAD